MARSISEQVYDRARSKALEDISVIYPELWEFLLNKTVAEYRTEGHPIQERYGTSPNRVYDKARSDAKTALREAKPGGWAMLMWAWSNHFKVEFGWVDGRYAPGRDADGRFCSDPR